MLVNDLHCDTRVFTSFVAFQPLLEADFASWPAQVQEALRLIALHGILDPISVAPIPASELVLRGDNYR